MLPVPEPETMTDVGTVVSMVATGTEDSGATVLTADGVDCSFPPAAEDDADAWVGASPAAVLVGAGLSVEVSEDLSVAVFVGVASVADAELSTGATEVAGGVDPETATPHAPSGLSPGNASIVPRIVSSIGL